MKAGSPRTSAAVSLFLAALALEGQGIPMATLSGTVSAAGGAPLPGVTVTAESPHLQGKREATTFATGEYLFNFLPSGGYIIRFSAHGMQTIENTISLSAAGSGRLDVTMRPAAVAESVTVSAEAQTGTPLDTTEVMANYKKALTDRLPIARTLHSIVLLAPGVTDNGPVMLVSSDKRPGLMLAGAQSYESLYLIDGATVNQNISGQPQELYIDDAIEETTILGGNVSAEYGRFTGGVVNTVTRSGGNDFHGSFRTGFSSDAWRALNPDEENFDFDPRIGGVNETYQATLGGLMWKDRIWFFVAGRKGSVSDSRYTSVLEQAELGDQGVLPNPYTHSVDESRIQGKLTGNLTPQHNLVASYVSIDEQETNANTDPPGDLAALISPRRPSSLLTLNYNGVLTRNLFLEAQYAQRKSSVEHQGSPYSDFLRGTTVNGRGALYNSSWFSQGEPEQYGNDSWLAKAAYFLSTQAFGTHDLKVGYEWFSKSLFASYHGSGSDFSVQAQDVILRGTQAFPVFTPLSGGLGFTSLDWSTIPPPKKTTVVTQSAFFNDRLVWGAHWSFNLGLRYDRTDASAGVGPAVAKSAAWSPRLAAQFDPRGDGRVVLNAGYAKYVSSVQDILIHRFSAAFPSDYEWYYDGPCINCDRNAPTNELVPMDQALAQVDAWFQGIGGIESPPTGFVRIMGVTRAVPKGTLETPSAKEYSVGAGTALGSRGWARADFIYRDYGDFYNDRQDMSTGQAQIPGSDPPRYADIDILGNSNTLDRKYEAVQAQFQYRFSPAFFAGGSYTWSRLTGNFVGQNLVVGAAPGHIDGYPEYRDLSWNSPAGYLPGDQRNIARIWLEGNFSTRFGEIGLAVLQSYESGLPYEAVASVPLYGYVSNPGYATPPIRNTYFFSKRGEFRTDNITSTDIALTLMFHLFGAIELFVEPVVTNLFNESGAVAKDATVLEGSANGLQDFNLFTEKPVRGVNYELAESFGTPTAYQQPRTFVLSVGLRF